MRADDLGAALGGGAVVGDAAVPPLQLVQAPAARAALEDRDPAVGRRVVVGGVQVLLVGRQMDVGDVVGLASAGARARAVLAFARRGHAAGLARKLVKCPVLHAAPEDRYAADVVVHDPELRRDVHESPVARDHHGRSVARVEIARVRARVGAFLAGAVAREAAPLPRELVKPPIVASAKHREHRHVVVLPVAIEIGEPPAWADRERGRALPAADVPAGARSGAA